MGKAVAVVYDGEKHRIGMVEPTLVLRSLFRRGFLGGYEDGTVEGGVLTCGKWDRGNSCIFRKSK